MSWNKTQASAVGNLLKNYACGHRHGATFS